MFGSKRENGNCAGCRTLGDALEQQRRRVDALEYDLAQLTERFKRWQGRVSKQRALDFDQVEDEPAPRQLRPAGDGAAEVERVVAIRRSRGWPGPAGGAR